MLIPHLEITRGGISVAAKGGVMLPVLRVPLCSSTELHSGHATNATLLPFRLNHTCVERSGVLADEANARYSVRIVTLI